MSLFKVPSLRACCIAISFLVSSVVFAADFQAPNNVSMDGDRLVWDPVDGAGGYNIYWNYGYLTTVKNRNDYKMQFDGLYQVVAFDETATLFSSQFADGVDVTYEAGAQQDVVETLNSTSVMEVYSITCKDVGPGESCTASCLVPNQFRIATGGACSTSDIVEADATASTFSYSCTVPTFSGEVRAQVYCLNRQSIR